MGGMSNFNYLTEFLAVKDAKTGDPYFKRVPYE